MQAVFFVNLWPEPRSSAAGLRTRELATFVEKLGYTIVGVSPALVNAHAREWGVETLTVDPNSTEQAEALTRLQPSLVIYDRFYSEEKFGWRARELWPDALHVIDTSDLHCVRRARQNALKADSNVESPAAEFFDESFLREMAALHRADVSLLVSDYEEDWLRSQGFEANRMAVIPFSSMPAPDVKPLNERSGYCFIGNYLHEPNVDAVRWLARELWPALRETPGFESSHLHLYGAYPTQEIQELNGKNGIRVHGFVEDHRAALSKHEVMLAPLRFGAGIKGKVLEAWATGTPVLGTRIAFESMGDGFAEFQNPTDFIEGAKRLRDPRAWTSQRERGFEVLAQRFNPDCIFDDFARFISNSIEQLPTIRTSLTGRLLRHHGAQSLKYFSKWIEEKNRNRQK